MDNPKIIFSPLSPQELEAIQKDSPDILFRKMSQEDIDAAAEIIKELRAEEELNPILKQTPASLQLFRDKRQAEDHKVST